MRGIRSDIYKPGEVVVVHVMAKTVRHIYLFGKAPSTDVSYNYRRIWIEEQLYLQAEYFGIDLIAYAVMSNHFCPVLCSRPDLVKQWDDTEIATRWLHLCPKRKDPAGKAMELTKKELDKFATTLRKSPLRLRLRSNFVAKSPTYQQPRLKPKSHINWTKNGALQRR